MMPPERPPSSREAFAQAVELLRSDRSRGFNIDVETDTMVFEDQRFERQSRVEFITAVSQFLLQAVPAAQLYPQIGPLLIKMLMLGVRGFKGGRDLEQAFEQAEDQFSETSGQSQGQKPDQKTGPDPTIEMAKIKKDMEIERERLGFEREKFMADHQFRMAQLGVKTDLDRERMSHDVRATERDDARDDALAQAKIGDGQTARGLEAHKIDVNATLTADQINQRREQAAQMARSRQTLPQV